MSASSNQVQLFPTCLVDQLYPGVGRSVVMALEALGFEVQVPRGLVCCGQPAYNAGAWPEARKVVVYTLKILDRTEGPIIIPSGSCADMMIHQAENLFERDREEESLAKRVAGRCREFSSFYVQHSRRQHSQRRDDDVLPAASKNRENDEITLTYHSSCHLSRGLGIVKEPLELLQSIPHSRLTPLPDAESCCGFGGMFSVKQPEISTAMMKEKIASIQRSGASCVVSCDLGCLMHIKGGLRRQGIEIEAKHVAELLAPDHSGEES